MKSDKKLKRKIGVLAILGMLMLMAISATYTAQTWGRDETSDTSFRIIIDNDEPTGPDDEVFAVWHDGTGGSELFRVQEDGRVGIGDTSPDFKLEVTGSSGSGYFGVTTSNDGDIFIIDSSGNVGIGTTTPDAKLDVEVSSGGAAEFGSSTNYATGDYAVAMGTSIASGDYAVSMGSSTKASGDYSMAIGSQTEATNNAAFATGVLSSASGQFSFAAGNANASGLCTASIGWLTVASGDLSYAMGSLVQATEDYSMVFGRGDSGSGDLINNIESSLMIGFHSTTPTFFVDGSSVGIGTTTPATKLEVLDASNPQLRLSAAFSYYTDFQTTGSGYLYINPSGGRVGIGTNTPNEQLEVDGKIRTNSVFNVGGTDGITTGVSIVDNNGATHDLTFTGGILTAYSITP